MEKIGCLDVAFAAPLLVIVILAVVRRQLKTHAGLLLAGLALAVLGLLSPNAVGDAWTVHLRFAGMAGFALAVAVQPDFARSIRHQAALTLAVLALVVGRSAWIGQVWTERQADVRSVRAALRSVAPGATVLSVYQSAGRLLTPRGRHSRGGGGDKLTFVNLGLLALPQQRAFVANIPAVPGQQAFRIQPPWRNHTNIAGDSVNAHVLDQPQEHQRAFRYSPHLREWRWFDYILLLQADVTDQQLFQAPLGLELVADQGFARLYRITKN